MCVNQTVRDAKQTQHAHHLVDGLFLKEVAPPIRLQSSQTHLHYGSHSSVYSNRKSARGNAGYFLLDCGFNFKEKGSIKNAIFTRSVCYRMQRPSLEMHHQFQASLEMTKCLTCTHDLEWRSFLNGEWFRRGSGLRGGGGGGEGGVKSQSVDSKQDRSRKGYCQCLQSSLN